ncbi:hypothetical protein HOG21_03115 [bacterium]|nr:hypothetical protein [bacterium]
MLDGIITDQLVIVIDDEVIELVRGEMILDVIEKQFLTLLFVHQILQTQGQQYDEQVLHQYFQMIHQITLHMIEILL